MNYHRWVYVSRAVIDSDAVDSVVQEIVEAARRKNLRLSITGALAFTGVHFAQLIEGPPDAVNDLRTAIARDDRHSDVTTLEYGRSDIREFEAWSLAYSGRSLVLGRRLSTCFRRARQGIVTSSAEVIAILQRLVGRQPA